MEVVPSPLSRGAWEAALGAAPLQQRWDYGVLAARNRTVALRFDLREHGAVAGHAQVLLRHGWPGTLALLSRGPVWHTAPLPGAIAALARALPGWPRLLVATGADAGLPLGPRPVVAELDLRPDANTLRGGLRGKWRNRLARAEGQGIAVQASPRVPRWLIRREADQRMRRHYRGLPVGWPAAWGDLPGDGVLTLTAGPPQAPVAALCLLLHGRSASYQLGWTGAFGRRLNAHNLLMWQAILALRDRGIERLDLGRIDTAPPGLARFKRGTGAQEVALGRTGLVPGGLRPGSATTGRSPAPRPAWRW